MLWRGSIPSISTVILGVAGPHNGQVADDVAISTTNNSNCFNRALSVDSSKTYLPRGVVRPMPLYMTVEKRDWIVHRVSEYVAWDYHVIHWKVT